MAHCTYAELYNLTMFQELAQTQVDAIIAEADRQVNTYLGAKGVSTATTDATKSASLALSKALLLELGYNIGQTNTNDHDYVNPPLDITTRVKDIRATAYATLDAYAAIQTTLDTPRKVYLMKVN